MNFVILVFGVASMLWLAFRSVYFAETGDRVLAWYTFSWFCFLGRWLGAFWIANGEAPRLDIPENYWYLDTIRSDWLIALLTINLTFSLMAASIRDWVIGERVRKQKNKGELTDGR